MLAERIKYMFFKPDLSKNSLIEAFGLNTPNKSATFLKCLKEFMENYEKWKLADVIVWITEGNKIERTCKAIIITSLFANEIEYLRGKGKK